MKTKILAIRLNPQAHAVLKREAERIKRTPSDYARIILQEKLPQMVEKAGKR